MAVRSFLTSAGIVPRAVADGSVGDPVLQLVEVAQQLARRDQVLRALAGQLEQRVDDRRRAVADLRHVAVPALDDLAGVLPRGRLGEQPALRLDAQPQRVLADQTTGERVVRRDVRVAVGLTQVGHQPLGGQAAQPAADPLGQLAGGLAGERQAEHLVGRGQLVGDQPDHPGRHRLGLARARAGDDEQRRRAAPR